MTITSYMTAIQRIILFGDIETNPGPTKKNNPSKHNYQSISVATYGSCKNHMFQS